MRQLSLDYSTSEAGNPFVDGWYADPDTEFYEGKYWVFPTSSYAYEKQTYLDAFSSDDLIHWEKHENILTIADVKWATRAVWAPAPISRNGKYYLYFGANDIQEGEPEAGVIGGIGVAVADKPEGPYVDAIGKPLIGEYHNGAQPIDQDVFIDDDGQAYIFYGGHSHCNIAPINEDMISIGQFDDGTSFKEITPEGYVEGSQMIKRNGIYYLMWSEGGWTGPNYSVSYAMSDSVMGPFNKLAKILEQDSAVAKGSGHNGVIHIPGTDIWYIIYHRRPLSESDGNHRVLAYDRMYFNEDGTIASVTMLVKDNFADGQVVGWKQYGDGFSVIDERLTSSGAAIAMLDTNFTDLVYDATISVPDSSVDAGLLFRATNASGDIAQLNGYQASISGSGSITLQKIVDGAFSVLSQGDASLVAGREYHVRVTAVASEINVFVEDMESPKITAADDVFLAGTDGVRSSGAGARCTDGDEDEDDDFFSPIRASREDSLLMACSRVACKKNSDAPEDGSDYGMQRMGNSAALAVEFQLRGLRVFATARDLSKTTILAALGIETLQLDVTSESSIEQAVAIVREKLRVSDPNDYDISHEKPKAEQPRYDRLDLLINNAGVNFIMPFSDTKISDLSRVFNTNVIGSLAVTQAFIPLLMHQGDGAAKIKSVVAMLGSVNEVFLPPYQLAYNTSKVAVHAAARALRVELAPLGIHCVTLMTGSVRSRRIEDREFLRDAHWVDADDFARQVVDELLKPKPKPDIWRGGLARVASWLAWLGWDGILESAMVKANHLDEIKI
ncbi:hypothetical protein NPX13_g4779 [Xylaria arbuscula]|uniref:Uncharacterized protein n=1 Tax=Xylaria arbuscula TaxID=114810 RepID=A0A9W8NFU4_9PEZI|nr:hypothetical protein NPX13_g4779 [Xylaria arbuscula]